MNQEKLKNIIILRDIPSNLVDEAIIILKDNNQVNKKRMEDYAKDEGKNIIKEFLNGQKSPKTNNKKKLYFIISFAVIILILNFVRLHIF